MTLAELNNLAQEIANKLGHISQEKLVEIHRLVNDDVTETAAASDA
jgi:hypothetical protein